MSLLVTYHLIICVALTCLYWSCALLIIYHGIQFYKLRGTQIIVKRYHELTIITVICSFLALTLFEPYGLAMVYLEEINESNNCIRYTFKIVWTIFTYGILYIIMMRNWLLWYQVHWTRSTADAQWKVLVSKDILARCWFLTHKNRYGSKYYVFRLVLIPYSFSIIVTLGIDVYSVFFAENWSTFYNLLQHMLLLGIPCIIAAILWFKTPDLNDSFGVIHENRIAMRIGFILLILYPLISVTPFVGATKFTRSILGNILNSSFFVTAGVYYTLYAIRLTQNYDDNPSGSLPSTPPSSSKLSLNIRNHLSLNSRSTSNNNNHQNVDSLMQIVLSQDIYFNEFMSHLSNEFSMELLLSFVEFVQFKQAIKLKKELVLNDDLMISQSQQTVLQNGFIPASFVVHSEFSKVVQDFNGNYHAKVKVESNNDKNEHKKILNQYQIRGYILYYKFIDSSSEFQINLSDHEFKRLHNKIVNHRNKLNEEDLFLLFDATLSELWKLLRHSFYRFIKTDKYKQLNIENV